MNGKNPWFPALMFVLHLILHNCFLDSSQYVEHTAKGDMGPPSHFQALLGKCLFPLPLYLSTPKSQKWNLYKLYRWQAHRGYPLTLACAFLIGSPGVMYQPWYPSAWNLALHPHMHLGCPPHLDLTHFTQAQIPNEESTLIKEREKERENIVSKLEPLTYDMILSQTR